MNPQQEHLMDLLMLAREDLLAGRPAQRTAYALRQALNVVEFTDMDKGLADDQAWRRIRGIA